MVLVGALLASKLSNHSRLEKFQSSMILNKENITTDDYNDSVKNSTLSFCILVIFVLLNIVPALLIAYHCSKTNIDKGINMLLALLFSDAYMFYFTVNSHI